MVKALKVLEALLNGLPVQMDGWTYRMDSEYRLCVPARNETTGDEVLLIVNFGEGIALSAFIKACERQTQAEYETMAANIALNAIREGQRYAQ